MSGKLWITGAVFSNMVIQYFVHTDISQFSLVAEWLLLSWIHQWGLLLPGKKSKIFDWSWLLPALQHSLIPPNPNPSPSVLGTSWHEKIQWKCPEHPRKCSIFCDIRIAPLIQEKRAPCLIIVSNTNTPACTHLYLIFIVRGQSIHTQWVTQCRMQQYRLTGGCFSQTCHYLKVSKAERHPHPLLCWLYLLSVSRSV